MIQRTLFRAARPLSRVPPTASPAFRPVVPRLATATPRRFYADAAAKEAGTETSPEASAQSAEETLGLKKALEAKTKECMELKDKYLRAIADYRNLQDRTKREAQAAKDFALQKFARDLLSSLDNLEAGLTSVPTTKLASHDAAPVEEIHADLVNLHKGLQLTEKVLLDTLKRHGVSRFDPAAEGVKFDPNRHEAVFHTPVKDKEDGVVFHTQQKGYLLNGRVLRAAQVGVVKNP
ncbi:GrpE-domain-containing protein [Trichodelitschia bisporula]|uniref:GrpE protein homolog n=1 Tax=Trichodelitschia bisporula TaxID=703511 RepID=A0A6G1HWE9_9PEZI|nr:GrpE-domain-containing protein [Trichodelitschia bisporula]